MSKKTLSEFFFCSSPRFINNTMRGLLIIVPAILLFASLTSVRLTVTLFFFVLLKIFYTLQADVVNIEGLGAVEGSQNELMLEYLGIP